LSAPVLLQEHAAPVRLSQFPSHSTYLRYRRPNKSTISMKILITGGAGFIGSHLADELIRRDHDVYIIDDISTGQLANIDQLLACPRLTLYIDSILNEALLQTLVSDVDIIFHLAASVGVKRILDHPIHSIDVNVGGTEKLLRLASNGNKRVIFASSIEVQGKSIDLPVSEDAHLAIGPPSHARWSYACAKAMGEFLAFAYHQERRLPVTIVRLCNTVGPRQSGRYGMVLPRLLAQAVNNEPLTVYGSGQQSRCFAYVTDVVDALVKCMNSEQAVGEIFNIGSAEEVSINELAFRIISLSGSKSQVTHIPYPQAYSQGFDDIIRLIPNFNKATDCLGYSPVWKLDDIIRSMLSAAYPLRSRLISQ
jgi:UDP-glucose 4-epimerase